MPFYKAKQFTKSRELGLLLNSTLMQRRILYSCMGILNPIVPHLFGMDYLEIKEWLINNPKEAYKLRTYLIGINDFNDTWEIGGNSILDKINKAIGYDYKIGGSPEIMRMCFRLASNKKNMKFINVISSIEVRQDLGVIEIELTDSILPYLINLTSYISVPLRATLGFKSNYSFTMLEHLLIRYVGNGKYPIHNISLDELHTILGTSSKKSYQEYGSLKKIVLDAIARDFSNVSGGGYDLNFEPIYRKSIGRGRPKVESVHIHFNDAGFKKFLATKKAQRQGLDSTKNASSEAQQALKYYEIEQQKQRDIKISQEEFGF